MDELSDSLRAGADEKEEPEGQSAEAGPRHRQIYQELLREIWTGVYQPGDRLPSEAMLSERFGASRITVAKAIQQLQREKLVSRIAGSGTYVEAPAKAPAYQFGLLIPELGSTEIFEPICQGMMKSPLARTHSLIWGHFSAGEENRLEAAEQLCRQYIEQRVAGVFFAPIEYLGGREQANREIVAALCRAKIPIVLLDRCYEPYPGRAPYDLIGIDNHRAGFVVTRHLLQAGAVRPAFAARPDSATTVEARIAGYRRALETHRPLSAGMAASILTPSSMDRSPGTPILTPSSMDRSPGTPMVFRGDFGDVGWVGRLMDEYRPDGFVCANDATAAKLMLSLGKLGIAVPGEVRLTGIDDVNYAKFLPVPLTTLHQNCHQMGAVAFSTMLERLQSPETPPREILLPCELIVRESCGAHLSGKGRREIL